MKILDRYISRLYLVNTAVLFVVIFCFVVAIDVSINLDRFYGAAEKLSGDSAGFLRNTVVTVLLIGDLWWPRLLNLFNILLGVMMVVGMGFTASQLVRHRELVAVLASGQSLFRVGRPLLLVALTLSTLQVLNQELVIPRIAPLVLREHRDAGQRDLAATRVPLVPDSRGNRFYALRFDPEAGVMEQVAVWIFEPGAHNPSAVLYADKAVWRVADGRGGWDFEPPARAESRRDLAEKLAPVARVETDLDPETLRIVRYEGYGDSLSWAQATQMIALLQRTAARDARGRLAQEPQRRVEQLQRVRFGRVSSVLANLLAVVICMPFFVTRLPTNMVLQSLKCAPVAIVALAGSAVGSSLSVPGLPAAVGVFLPVLILLPAAIATLTSVRT